MFISTPLHAMLGIVGPKPLSDPMDETRSIEILFPPQSHEVNNELMINSFSVKLWSNVPNTEM